MEHVKIEAQLRSDLGKKGSNHLRKQGMIPCNLYGGNGNINFYAPATSFKSLVFTPDFKIAELIIDGKTYKAIVKDLQADPVSDTITHLDFQELVDDRKVKIEVPLKLTGTPKAASMGGKVEQTMRKLTVYALPKDLPAVITLDVSDMDFGSIKRMKELSMPGVTLLHSPSIPIARMATPRAVKEEAAAAAAAAAPAKK